MSLKAFHVLFVAASTLLAAGFSFWAFQTGATTLGAGGLVVTVMLPVYGWWFLGKTRGVSYL